LKKINYRGISIYRIQNGKMVETWHVVDGGPTKLKDGNFDLSYTSIQD
jgi:hypothetical protein